jgi:hypothetical protein
MTQPAHDSPHAYLGLFGADAASLLFEEMLNPSEVVDVPRHEHIASEIVRDVQISGRSSWKCGKALQDEFCATVFSQRSRKKAGKKRARDSRNSRRAGYSRRARVDSRLLYASLPSKEILMALDIAKSSAAAVAVAETDAEKDADTISKCPWKSWETLQKSFLNEYEQRIRNELGQTVQISPVHPSNQGDFLSSCDTASAMPLPAYHGTKSRNIASICSRGLLIPGRGGSVRVENGSAHGVGIYTAKLGCAELSKSFCDSNAMFICGVCDGSQAQEDLAQNLLRSAPLAKWTSGVSLHHRQHRQHRVATAPTTPQRMLGNFLLHKDTGYVRHVGNAMVVFDEARVAPLFLAENVAGCGRPFAWLSMNRSPQVLQLWPMGVPTNLNHGGHPQRVGRRRTLIKETQEVVWLPPEPTGDRHDVRTKRCVESKRKNIRRHSEREEKFEAQLLHKDNPHLSQSI